MNETPTTKFTGVYIDDKLNRKTHNSYGGGGGAQGELQFSENWKIS